MLRHYIKYIYISKSGEITDAILYLSFELITEFMPNLCGKMIYEWNRRPSPL